MQSLWEENEHWNNEDNKGEIMFCKHCGHEQNLHNDNGSGCSHMLLTLDGGTVCGCMKFELKVK